MSVIDFIPYLLIFTKLHIRHQDLCVVKKNRDFSFLRFKSSSKVNILTDMKYSSQI